MPTPMSRLERGHPHIATPLSRASCFIGLGKAVAQRALAPTQNWGSCFWSFQVCSGTPDLFKYSSLCRSYRKSGGLQYMAGGRVGDVADRAVTSPSNTALGPAMSRSDSLGRRAFR
jgi:hypothetical protein